MAVVVGTASLHTTNNTPLTLPNPLFLISFPSNSHLRNPKFPSPLRLRRRLSQPLPSHPVRCLAANPGRPPPDSDPNPDTPRLARFEKSVSRFQDRVQIFFAVLFWMSLFFWTCAWDDRNKPNKGSRFRR